MIMKTSNKILLALFLLPFITVLFIMLTVHAKIKNGDYITEKQERDKNSITTYLAPFTDIDLGAFKNGAVTIKYSDSFYINYDKSQKEHISFGQEGNTLGLITKRDNDNYSFVTVYCPAFSKLRFDSLSVFIDSMQLTNVQIEAGAAASLRFAARAANLTLSGLGGSDISLEGSATVDTLNLQLSNGATFNNMHGMIRQLGQVKLADSATLNVDGRTMQEFINPPKPAQP